MARASKSVNIQVRTPLQNQLDELLVSSGCVKANVQETGTESGFIVGMKDGEVIVFHWIPFKWILDLDARERDGALKDPLKQYFYVINNAHYNVKDCGYYLKVSM